MRFKFLPIYFSRNLSCKNNWEANRKEAYIQAPGTSFFFFFSYRKRVHTVDIRVTLLSHVDRVLYIIYIDFEKAFELANAILKCFVNKEIETELLQWIRH